MVKLNILRYFGGVLYVQGVADLTIYQDCIDWQ
jgi:hypothetical protein